MPSRMPATSSMAVFSGRRRVPTSSSGCRVTVLPIAPNAWLIASARAWTAGWLPPAGDHQRLAGDA